MPFKVDILIVDGDKHSSNITKDVLSKMGYNKHRVASTIDSAKSFLDEKLVLFVVIERQVKSRDSLEFVRWLRQNTGGKIFQTPIIMLMPNPTKKDVKEARDAGVTEFLMRPFSPEAFRKTISVVLNMPRNFIISRQFIGPDRRRKSEQPPDGVAKRKEGD